MSASFLITFRCRTTQLKCYAVRIGIHSNFGFLSITLHRLKLEYLNIKSKFQIIVLPRSIYVFLSLKKIYQKNDSVIQCVRLPLGISRSVGNLEKNNNDSENLNKIFFKYFVGAIVQYSNYAIQATVYCILCIQSIQPANFAGIG